MDFPALLVERFLPLSLQASHTSFPTFRLSQWPASWEICVQVKKQQLELDVEQQTGSKSGKEYVKAAYVTLFI